MPLPTRFVAPGQAALRGETGFGAAVGSALDAFARAGDRGLYGRWLGGLLGLALASTASAQSTTPLPQGLSGEWTYRQVGTAFIDTFAIVFDGERLPGRVTGKMTWRGVNCGLKDEPIQATWDGSVLTLETVFKSDTNTVRRNGTCSPAPVKITLQSKDGRSFEGEANSDTARVTLTARANP